MICAHGLIAPFRAFVALINFRAKAKRHAPPPVQVESEPRDDTHPVATPEVSKATIETRPIVRGLDSVFDELRGAMDGGDENIFRLLQIALEVLVMEGLSFEVCSTLNLT